ncbi:hybrid sensor histidine kinase/response regulator, partial [Caulobacter sp. HMWF009]
MACACFMLQQWSVARQEARANNLILTQMVAAGAAAPLSAGDLNGVRTALDAVDQAPHVVEARIVGPDGRLVARVGKTPAADDPVQSLQRPVILDGRTLGTLVLTAHEP